MRKLIFITIVLLSITFLALQAEAVIFISGSPAAAGGGGNQTIDIAANNDDGNIRSCQDTGSGPLQSSGDGSNRAEMGEFAQDFTDYGFYRFQLSSALPNGSTITTAYVTLEAATTWSWTFTTGDHGTLHVFADNAADAAQVSSADDCPESGTGVTVATANVAWSPTVWTTDVQYQSPELKTIFQELVDDNGGMAQNAYVQLWIGTNPVASDPSMLHAYDESHATGTVAQLYIEWTN